MTITKRELEELKHEYAGTYLVPMLIREIESLKDKYERDEDSFTTPHTPTRSITINAVVVNKGRVTHEINWE